MPNFMEATLESIRFAVGLAGQREAFGLQDFGADPVVAALAEQDEPRPPVALESSNPAPTSPTGENGGVDATVVLLRDGLRAGGYQPGQFVAGNVRINAPAEGLSSLVYPPSVIYHPRASAFSTVHKHVRNRLIAPVGPACNTLPDRRRAGDLVAESAKDRGTRFYLCLPRE
jgi:hypothetical protein